MSAPVNFTPRQGEYLAFIRRFTARRGVAPSFEEIGSHFGTTAPSVNGMIKTLERRRLLSRVPGQARSLRVLVPEGLLPGSDFGAAPRRNESPRHTSCARECRVRAGFAGRWRLVEMEQWNLEDSDRKAAHVTFHRGGRGEFSFLLVEGDMDCRFSEGGLPHVDFSWEGHDECDPATGRGWAVLDGEVLRGRIYFHGGDDSGFVAKR